jgi:hypothetical protein
VRWIAATVCVLVVLGLGYMYWSRNVLRTTFDEPPASGEVKAVVAPLPAPGSEVSEYRRIAYESCAAARNDWLSLAQMFGTRATPEAIARGYARYAHEPAVYDACLRGFRG